MPGEVIDQVSSFPGCCATGLHNEHLRFPRLTLRETSMRERTGMQAYSEAVFKTVIKLTTRRRGFMFAWKKCERRLAVAGQTTRILRTQSAHSQFACSRARALLLLLRLRRMLLRIMLCRIYEPAKARLNRADELRFERARGRRTSAPSARAPRELVVPEWNGMAGLQRRRKEERKRKRK